MNQSSLSLESAKEEPPAFAPFCFAPQRLYPIVEDAAWVERVLAAGVKTIQLRIKNQPEALLKKEIQRSVDLAKSFEANLFINDYWQLAIECGAAGIHLGQEDLLSADIATIRASGLYLGISTHSYDEVVRASLHKPSYLACGPIFSTTSKIMSFDPQGLDRLQYWQQTLDYPLVAIGGINETNWDEVAATNVAGIAMISAITKAHDPIAAIHYFLNRVPQS